MKKLDFHVHTHGEITAERSAEYFKDMIERHGYSGICVQALLHSSGQHHPNGNSDALAISKMLPGSYAFAGLDHRRDLVEQTEEYMAQGFKGIKLLEGKPSEWKHYGFSYSDPYFEPFFAYCEERQIPLMIHNNDPLENWDITKATPRAIEKGWVYDQTFPTQEWFFEQLEQVLYRHPNLKAAIAHFGFYSNNIPRAERLMEACPNLYMDITPAIIIYPQLSQTPEKARAFFRKYHTRIIYGTDADSELKGFAREYNDTKVAIITHFLQGDAPKEIAGHYICPIKLEPQMLENIYYHNAVRFIAK